MPEPRVAARNFGFADHAKLSPEDALHLCGPLCFSSTWPRVGDTSVERFGFDGGIHLMQSPSEPLKADSQASTPPADSPAANGQADIEALADSAAAKLGIDQGDADIDPSKSIGDRVKTVLIGKVRDLSDTSIYHTLSLAAFLAWVGLGADGLSSSAYGPPEAFANLQGHTYLAVFLAIATAVTVFVISACYSHIIEEFPTGGGGYLVASKLLGRHVGVISGCALLVDYALTITVSIAAAGDALFGLIGTDYHHYKLVCEFIAIGVLIVLNLRGIKESVIMLLPIFMIFLITHCAARSLARLRSTSARWEPRPNGFAKGFRRVCTIRISG